MTNTEKMMREMVTDVCGSLIAEREKMATELLKKVTKVVSNEMIKKIKEDPFKTYSIVSLEEGEFFTADEIHNIINMIEYYNVNQDGINQYLNNLFSDIDIFREIEVETVKDIGMIHVTIYFN